MDIKKFVDGLTFWLKAEISPLQSRLSALEDRSLVPGKDGVDGKDGAMGAEGPQGVGLDGKDGKDGRDGKDADPELIKALIAEEVAKITLPKDGANGADGKDADPEHIKALISEQFAQIQPPKDGRDALNIEILPAIDASKSFPRGTYAMHKNGLFRAYQATSGMKGWECVVAGISDVSVKNDRQNFNIRMELSDGNTFEEKFTVPVMVYRGIFKQGEAYTTGDTVTFGGSLWHCNDETSDRPGDGVQAWSLCAKKGRDGKSA